MHHLPTTSLSLSLCVWSWYRLLARCSDSFAHMQSFAGLICCSCCFFVGSFVQCCWVQFTDISGSFILSDSLCIVPAGSARTQTHMHFYCQVLGVLFQLLYNRITLCYHFRSFSKEREREESAEEGEMTLNCCEC